MTPLDLASAIPIPAPFFARPTATVARELIGTVVVSRVGDSVVAGRIVETEAYLGAHDPGSHAATRGITPRNRVMYGPPGHVYVYVVYGMHLMVNLVTEPEGVAGAVLVRAVEPIAGIETMSARRGGATGTTLADGPAKVAAALGVTLAHNGMALGDALAVVGTPPPEGEVRASGRIGLAEGHDLPLRFYLHGDPHVSRGRTGPRTPRRRPDIQTEETT